MRHRKQRKKLCPTASQHEGLMLSLLKGLFQQEEVKTTQARGKELRRLAEHLIAVAGKRDVHSRRGVFRILRDKEITHSLCDSIAPRFAGRKGGYTQLVRLGHRRGDGAPMILVKLLQK